MTIDEQKKSVVIESKDLTVPVYERTLTLTFNDEQYKDLGIRAKNQNITIQQLLEEDCARSLLMEEMETSFIDLEPLREINCELSTMHILNELKT